MDNHREAYREEATELLAELESSLLELEERPDDPELIGRVFRAMHTIKGSGAMFGFEDIAAFTHEVETVFDLVRDNKVYVTRDLVDLTLSACDQIGKMVQGEGVDESRLEELVAAFRAMLHAPCASRGESVVVEPGEEVPGGLMTYRIRFRPERDIFATGTNPILLLDELNGLGELKVVAQTTDIPGLKELDAEACYIYWDMILSTDRGINSVRDVFIFVEDECELKIDLIDEGDAEEEGGYKRLGEILVERNDVTPEKLQEVLSVQKRVGEMLVDAEVIDPEVVSSALAEQDHIRQMRAMRREVSSASSVRVESDKLDTLVDLVGELVTVQASLSQRALLQNDPELLPIAEEVERLTGELRDNTMSIRMLPIGTTFSKFKRLVRDLSNELGKEVVMRTEGAETELDKTVIERLNDPLVHIIRNSIDHGIESPDVRSVAGKSRQGSIVLSAVHSGANVLIRVSDDGAGLDVNAIRARAAEKGLIAQDADLTASEIFTQIFAPGFSTAKEVTDISGRGVGMDVVKRSIEALRGSIEIESEKGNGTTITLRLPLTLAIIDGLLVTVGDAQFVLPLSIVEECVELTQEDTTKNNGNRIAKVRGEIVPYILLRDLFSSEGDPPLIQQIVVVEVEGNRFGFVVDQVIGEHQTVMKTLGGVYKNSREFSGATILADGRVAVILDVHRLAETALEEERLQNKEVLRI